MGLISTIDEFRNSVGVNINSKLAAFLPDLVIVEAERIKPLLGAAYYYELEAKARAYAKLSDAAKAEQTELSALELEVLLLLQCTAATLAMVSYLPLNQVQLSDMGVHVITTGDKKTAFQWQIKDLQANFTRKGYNAMERALDLLDEHIDAPWAEAWATSAAATAARKHYLNTARQFSEHYNIGDSRLTFLAMLPTLRKMERFSIEPVLGMEYAAELREQLLDGDVTPDNKQVLDMFVRPALAHLTIAKAIPEIGLSLNGGALELNVYRFDDSNAKEADASIDSLMALKVSQAKDDAGIFLEKLRAFLNQYASATRYATYFNSRTYQAPGARSVFVATPTDSPSYSFLG